MDKNNSMLQPSTYERKRNSIIRLTESKRSFGLNISKARLRSKKELNDQILEKRIRKVFDNIREAETIEYQQGLKEIQYLLELRQSAFVGLTSSE